MCHISYVSYISITRITRSTRDKLNEVEGAAVQLYMFSNFHYDYLRLNLKNDT